jgi:predicted RecA/RadA family phage recombinase
MALNEVFRNANHLGLPVNAAVVSGDVVVLGAIAGIAQTSYSARDGKATVWFDGAYELVVANGTYTVGQPIYAHAAGGGAPVDGTKAPLLDGTSATGVLLGHSIEAKTTTGGTGTLRVRLAA